MSEDTNLTGNNFMSSDSVQDSMSEVFDKMQEEDSSPEPKEEPRRRRNRLMTPHRTRVLRKRRRKMFRNPKRIIPKRQRSRKIKQRNHRNSHPVKFQ